MVDRRCLGRAFLDYGLFAILGTVYLVIAVGFVRTQRFAFQHMEFILPFSLLVVLSYRRFRATYRTYDMSREILLFLAAVTGIGALLMAVGGVVLHVREVWMEEGFPVGGTRA